jgi:hypothetical protein
MLKFKLFEKDHPNCVPLAAVVAPPKVHSLATVDHHLKSSAKAAVHKVGADMVTPYRADSDVISDPNSLSDGFLVSDHPQYNVYYILKKKTYQEPNIRIVELYSGNAVSDFKVEYENNGSWLEIPDIAQSAQIIRIVLSDEVFAGGPLLVSYTLDSSRTNHQELVQEVEPLHSFQLTIENGYLKIIPQGALIGKTPLYIKANALQRIRVAFPNYQWYHDWHPLFYRGYWITEELLYNLKDSGGYNAPSYYDRMPVSYLSRNIVALPIPDIDTTKPVEIYFDDEKQGNIVADMCPYHGILRLHRPIPSGARCYVSWSISRSNWRIASDVDYNPHRGHNNTNIFSGITYYLQPLPGNALLRSHLSGIAFYETFKGSVQLTDRYLPLATVKVRQQSLPQVADIRRQAELAINTDKLSNTETSGYTDIGYYDGIPVDNVALVVRIPRSAYDAVYAYYRDAGYSESEAHRQAETYIRQAAAPVLPAGVQVFFQDKEGNSLFNR